MAENMYDSTAYQAGRKAGRPAGEDWRANNHGKVYPDSNYDLEGQAVVAWRNAPTDIVPGGAWQAFWHGYIDGFRLATATSETDEDS